MKTANILLVIFAFIAFGIYKKYLTALINHRIGRTQPAVIPQMVVEKYGDTLGKV